MTISEKTALEAINTKPSEESRFSSRRLSPEIPILDTSFDVYYRESPVGIPFLWETQPGTPRIKSREFRIPPLTPPPSFHPTPTSRKPSRKQPRNSLAFLPKLRLKKKSQPDRSPSRSASSLSSSAWSTASSPTSEKSQRRVWSPPSRSVDSSFGPKIEEDDERESPASTLCFSGGRGKSRGGCSSGIARLLRRRVLS